MMMTNATQAKLKRNSRCEPNNEMYLLSDQPSVWNQLETESNPTAEQILLNNPSYCGDSFAEDFAFDNEDQQSVVRFKQEVGIYGWRKKFTYLILAVIFFLVGVNLLLTVWIVSFLGLSWNGIVGLDLSPEFAIFKGDAVFQKILFVKEIKAHGSNILKFELSNGNLSFQSNWRNGTDLSESKLLLNKGKVVIKAEQFEVYNHRNQLMFGLNEQSDKANIKSKLTVRTDSLQIQNNNKVRFPKSLQTTVIDSSLHDELSLISPQGKINLMGPKSVAVQSMYGDISLVTYQNLSFKSNRGKIIFEPNKSIYIRKLTTADVGSGSNQLDQTETEVYQLCICSNTGKLFVANANSFCAVQSAKDCH